MQPLKQMQLPSKCADEYLGSLESAISVFESYLCVHYLGKMSVYCTATVKLLNACIIADFFNTVASVDETVHVDTGECVVHPRLPHGGYWNWVKPCATREDWIAMRTIFITALGSVLI